MPTVYYGSPYSWAPPPMTPYGVSPAYYYHYYRNGLSHSYHDLSELQQQNMLSIMRRSGFITEDQFESLQQQTGGDGGANNNRQQQQRTSAQRGGGKKKKGPSATGGGGGRAPRKASVAAGAGGQPQPQQQGPRRGVLKQQESKRSPQRSQEEVEAEASGQSDSGEAGYPLVERSISMPAIGGGGAGSSLSSSDEQGGGGAGGVGGQTGQVSTDAEGPAEVISDEVIQELGMWEQVIQEEKKAGGDQTPDNKIEDTFEETEAPQQQQQQQASLRRASVAPPTVNIQVPTPVNMSAQSMVRFDENVETLEPAKSESIAEESGQEEEAGKGVEEAGEAETGGGGQQQQQQQADTSAVASPTDQQQQQQQQRRQSKAGPPPPSQLPQARRLSRVPQQLYIKTTPAIPMNANIQHILSNVARTEGPFQFPGEAVKPAVIALHDHAWTTKVEGMLAVVRLATFHPHYLHRDQHQIALALAAEIRNLRSTVSRSAIFTIGELFANLKSQIEPEMDILIQALLYKAGENSIFIREDIDVALQHMIDSMPQTRSAICLITFGSSHRNTYVRRTAAQFLAALVEKMGPMKCLLGPRDIGEHLLPAAARFIQDSSLHTRYFGRRMFVVLMQHPLFDRFLRKHVSPGTYRNISGMLETIRRRGIGDAPPDLYTPVVQPQDKDPRRLVVVGNTTGGDKA